MNDLPLFEQRNIWIDIPRWVEEKNIVVLACPGKPRRIFHAISSLNTETTETQKDLSKTRVIYIDCSNYSVLADEKFPQDILKIKGAVELNKDCQLWNSISNYQQLIPHKKYLYLK